MDTLTPGQLRVRELALPFAPMYQQLHEDWSISEEIEALYHQLYAALGTDPLLKGLEPTFVRYAAD